jgi:hypothetical protein
MKASRAPRFQGASIVRLPLMIAALLFALPASQTAAAQLTVDCSGQLPGAFTSITSAIDTLTGPPPSAEQWDYILLMGDCTENVRITGGLRLWIAPTWDPWPWSGSTTNGALARITAADTDQSVVVVEGSADVSLVHLALANGSNGLSIQGAASVTTYGVVAEDNSSSGFKADGGAGLTVYEGGAHRNGFYGISVGLGASVSASGSLPWLQEKPLVIRANQAGGVRVDRGRIYATSGFSIVNNGGPGLTAYAGVATFGEWQDGLTSRIKGNQGGAFVSEGSRVTLWGKVVVADNGAYGLYVEDGGHASFIAFTNSSEEVTAVVVKDHTSVGVNVAVNSQAAFHGPHRVRVNGSASDPTSAGIRVDGSSHVVLDAGNGNYGGGPPRITDNIGPGISADLGSSIDARAAILRHNAQEGVRVLHNSVAYLGSDSRVAPNAGGPVTCDATSLVVTHLVSANPACPQVEAPSGPRPERPERPQ